MNKILETAIYVKNIDTAEKFYRDVLGLKTYEKNNNRHVFFKISESMLLLFNPEMTKKEGIIPTHGTIGNGHIAFSVEHEKLDYWRKRLLDHEIEIEKEIEWPSGGKSIYFRDPDGNSLEFATPDIWP